MQAVIYPPTDRWRLQCQEKNYVKLPFWTVTKITGIHLRAMSLKPAFAENYGSLILGLMPVYYWISLQKTGVIQTLQSVKTLLV